MQSHPPFGQRIIALSISQSPDVVRLGLRPGEERRILAMLLPPLIERGARIAYGGAIAHPGADFTAEIATLVDSCDGHGIGAGIRPMIHYVRAADAQSAGRDRLFDHAIRLGSRAQVRLLMDDEVIATLESRGRIVDVLRAGQPPSTLTSGEELARLPCVHEFLHDTGGDGLDGMRRAVTRDCDARVLMGGAVAHSDDGVSGVAAEAISSLDANQPVLVIGGVGGASRDVASRLGLLDAADAVERDETAYVDRRGIPSKARYDARMVEVASRRTLFEQRAILAGVHDELRRLAVSQSPPDIAALVVDILRKWLPPRR